MMRRVMQGGEQLAVQGGVGVEASALIACMSTSSIGKTATGLLDEENPRHVIPLGCSSPQGTSCSLWDCAVGEARSMDSLMLV